MIDVVVATGAIVLALCVIVLVFCAFQQHPLPVSSRTLFVIAHPDDETMFFAPTIHGVRASGAAIYLLCLSTGNMEGLGVKRKYELAHAARMLGIKDDNIMLLDYDAFQDGFVSWCKEELAKAILRHMQILDVDTVITFDEDGVSAHPNHVSCFRALQYLYSNGLIPAGVQVFVLESVALWRKYALVLDACISAVHSTFLYVSSPPAYVNAWRAMLCHSTQLLWFRYLYMLFSRYVCINTLRRIPLQQRYYVYKKNT
ncbi:N-acetylglucosaminyl-phosphatidylinositol de-N-acetylase [Toxocara canis]|uniref:N-acetylglucosaminylphosphatidylinositol deacetylase n=1 Tax=Toxocara canis TaxID=6265 RepID=A0A0B2VAB2_TOXCA|nr:N-acetylglucosaminyl-phosphatidylinositol de-N-acetylase [Toxocara canis]